jgi:GcrA cell cycle regulator
VASPSLFWTDEHVLELRKLNSEGYSASQIGNRLGCSRNAVIGKLHRLQLPSLHKPTAAQPRQRAVRTPIVRIVRVNGNSDKMRVMQSVTGNLFEPRVVEAAPLHISFDDLTSTTCKYPFGDIPNMTFCGHLSAAGSSYCNSHHKLCWRKPEPPKQPYVREAA